MIRQQKNELMKQHETNKLKKEVAQKEILERIKTLSSLSKFTVPGLKILCKDYDVNTTDLRYRADYVDALENEKDRLIKLSKRSSGFES